MNPYNTPEITRARGNRAKTSGAAIARLVCGILGFLTGPITGIPALITGHIACKKVRNSGGTLDGSGNGFDGPNSRLHFNCCGFSSLRSAFDSGGVTQECGRAGPIFERDDASFLVSRANLKQALGC